MQGVFPGVTLQVLLLFDFFVIVLPHSTFLPSKIQQISKIHFWLYLIIPASSGEINVNITIV